MFSRLPRLDEENEQPDHPSKRESTNENFLFILDDEELLECFLNLPDANDLPFALDLERIAQGQNNDPALWQSRMQHPLQYPEQQFGNTRVLSYKPTPTSVWKICIPTQQLENVVQWFHQALNHCGLHRLLKTISMHLYHPRLRVVAENVTYKCDACQREKLPGPQYGQLPPQEASILP
jgi:hypothetical protein